MNAQDGLKLRMFATYCGLAYLVLVFGGMLLAGFLPPPSPSEPSNQIAAMFTGDELRIRLGMLAIMWGALAFIPFAAVIAHYMSRIEGGFGVLSLSALLGGVGNMVLTFYPGIWWLAAAFRPDRNPEIVYVLNDACWIQLIGGVSMYDALPISMAVAIFLDRSSTPVFPRWAGFAFVFLTLTIMPDQALFFFHAGPFAWNGLLSFWMPVIAFGVWFIVSFIILRKAVLQDRTSPQGPVPAA